VSKSLNDVNMEQIKNTLLEGIENIYNKLYNNIQKRNEIKNQINGGFEKQEK